MKEAAGEANMTVITIVLIAIVAAVATPLISNIMKSTKEKTCCNNAGGKWEHNKCASGGNEYYDEDTYTACIGEGEDK